MMKNDRTIDLGPLDDAVAFHLSIAHTLALQSFLETIDERPRNARFVILLLIKMNPGITQAELSRTNFRDKSSMSPIIRDFVETGLVEKSAIKIQGRPAQALLLTEAGEVLLQRLKPFADNHSALVRNILGQEQHAELVRLLRVLADGLFKKVE